MAVDRPVLKSRWTSSVPFTSLIALALAVFALATYGRSLNLPFMGDDYVFLDKTRFAGFWELWSFEKLDFGWYRPWSREFHFWMLQKLFGSNEAPYRLANLGLWIAALSLYATFLRRLTSARVASLATLGVASLALWGTPLLWVSGCQDLWMLCFTLASLLLFSSSQERWALVSFGLALLSKETSAVLPAVLCAYVMLIERRPLGSALKQTAPFWTLGLVWLLVHPTLHTRLLHHAQNAEVEHRPAVFVILLKTASSTLNLDALPRPHDVGWPEATAALASVAILLGTAILALWRRDPPEHATATPGQDSLTRFGLVWVAAGWLPLILPSISWHAYYGCLGALGVWFLIALWLHDRPRLAIIVIVCVAVLRAAQANTPSWDWGTEWYQRRAGSFLATIRSSLHEAHPSLPPYSRVFFGHIPNNIGLVAGQSPAIRIWYQDATLQADFYSAYRPRPASEAPGEDFFFHFDSLTGLVEVRSGPEDLRQAMTLDPAWERNHEALAMLFLRSGDTRRAAIEFEKLSLVASRPDAAVYSGVCRRALGDSSAADSLISAAALRLHMPRDTMNAWVDQLSRTLPSGPASPP